MPVASPRTKDSDIPNIKFRLVAGAAAGNVTVTGIKARDTLLFVAPLDASIGDQTSEFTITADNTINNTGGTSTATKVLLVAWNPLPAGL